MQQVQGVMHKTFDQPDKVATQQFGKVEYVSLGFENAMKMTLRPGWTKENCEDGLRGFVISGTICFVFEGAKLIVRSNEAFVVSPQHSAFVEGQSDVILLAFEIKSESQQKMRGHRGPGDVSQQ